jgi:hypothetical protein
MHAPIRTFISPSDTSLQARIIEDSYILIDNLSEEFKVYRLGSARLKRLAFKENPSGTPPTQVTDIILDDSAVNALFFQYDKWHHSAAQSLSEVRSINAEAGFKAEVLLDCLSTFHSNITKEIMTTFERRIRVDDVQRNLPQIGPFSRLEHDIKMRVGSYKFPVDLRFKCHCESLQSHALQCGMLGSPYIDIGMDDKEDCNKLTVMQLQWIDKILEELHIHPIQGSRQGEVLAGLHEHKNNVISHIEAARFRNNHPDAVVQTVLTCELIYCCQQTSNHDDR